MSSWVEQAAIVVEEVTELPEVFGSDHKLPEIKFLDFDHVPELREELICDVLRVGHIMMLGGASKAGKTFLLIQLAYALACGSTWLGFDCKESRVLYLNLEVDEASFFNRCVRLIQKRGFDEAKCTSNVGVYSLRGYVTNVNAFAPQLVELVKDEGYQAVIIDPAYKFISGDENSAKDVLSFTNALDYISSELGVSIIYCAHHSKGAQGGKRSIDRVSGSGVFARHGDAIIDLTEIDVSDELRIVHSIPDEAVCYRVSATLRDFKSITPFEGMFIYPQHLRAPEGVLSECPEDSPTQRGARASAEKAKARTLENVAELEEYITSRLGEDGCERVSRTEAAEALGVTAKTINNYLEKSKTYTRENKANVCWIVHRNKADKVDGVQPV